MGGNAFQHASAPGEPTLQTPRMSEETYHHLRDLYRQRLVDALPGSFVDTLVEAPEKETYGDMDFVIARDNPLDWDWQQVADSIGARGFIRLSRHKCTLAVPADGTKFLPKAVQYMPVHENQEKSGIEEPPHQPAAIVPQKRQASSTLAEENFDPSDVHSPLSAVALYAHIDVEIVARDMYEWYMFYGSYGDMAGLLGHIVRHLGFTITDKGLYLRHKSLDDSKSLTYVNVSDREGMLHLSNDPDSIMRFLGLSVEDYRRGFKTVQELYVWLGKCRLLSPEAIVWKRDRSTERQKHKRAIFSNFLNYWLPEHRPDWVKSKTADTAQHSSEGTHHGTLEISQDSDQEGQAEADTYARPAAPPAPEASTLRNNHMLPKSVNFPDSVPKRRADLAIEAADFFQLRSEFEAMDATLRRRVGNAIAGELLKAVLRPLTSRSEKGLNEIVRAFRRQVGVDDQHHLSLLAVPHADEESELHRLIGDDGKTFKFPIAVKIFAEERWEETRERERLRAKAAKEKGGQI